MGFKLSVLYFVENCRFFKESSEEEREHAEKLIKYQVGVGTLGFLMFYIYIYIYTYYFVKDDYVMCVMF